MEFTDQQFYAIIYALAFAAGISRTFRDHNFSDYWNLLSVGLCSGFIGLACISMLSWVSGTRVGNEPAFVAVSIFLGLLGKEADKYGPMLLGWLLKRFGIKDE